MNILGIDTSCDETSCAVVRDGKQILSNVIASQVDLHRIYGGVVPEIACRAHIEAICPVCRKAFDEANVKLTDIDAVAVTNAPGLIGSLLIGLSFGKSIAWSLDVPLVTVNHIEAHTYACKMIYPEIDFPFVSLVASGGHTNIFFVETPLQFSLIGKTIDDAAGEAFDKVAKILNLGYPGGPAIERNALKGNPAAYDFPRSMMEKGNYDFSFSGIKTAVLYAVHGQDMKKTEPIALSKQTVADIASSFQEAVFDTLVAKTVEAADVHNVTTITVGGGVACNNRLKEKFTESTGKKSMRVVFPPKKMCTDNAAMIAGLAYHKVHAEMLATMDADAYSRVSYSR